MIFEVNYKVAGIGWETRLFEELPKAFHSCIGYKSIHDHVIIKLRMNENSPALILHEWKK